MISSPGADIFAPGDAGTYRTTSPKDVAPSRSYQLSPPNILIGAAGLLVLLWASHHLTRGRGRRR